MTTVDIIELGLKSCGFLFQRTRMDVRMSVSLVIKFIFFGLWFFESGDDKYLGGHFATTLITWVIFHLYILIIEKNYIIFGVNEVYNRRKWYKIVDFLQSTILFIYFSISVYANDNQSFFYNISITSLFADIALNFDQYLKFLERQRGIDSNLILERRIQGDEQVNQSGGEITLYCTMMIGAGLAMGMAILMQIELNKKPHLQTFPFYIWTTYLCAIGEAIFMCFIGYYLMPNVQKPDLNSEQGRNDYIKCFPSKHLLCSMYGLCIGFFSLYYAFFLGCYGFLKIAQKILQAIGWLAKNSNNQTVHPNN